MTDWQDSFQSADDAAEFRRMMEPTPPYLLVIYSAISIVIGIGSVIGIRWMKSDTGGRRIVDIGDYDTTEGEVVLVGPGRIPGLPDRRGRPRTSFKISYNYTVDGEQYTGDRWSFKDLDYVATGAMATSSTHRQFKPGAAITVYYHRKRPHDAVLSIEHSPPPSKGWYEEIFILLFFFAIAVLCWPGVMNALEEKWNAFEQSRHGGGGW